MNEKAFKNQITRILWIIGIIFFLNLSNLLAADPPADREVTNAVDRQLLFNSTTPSHFIDVETNEGVVTLTGSVSNILAKERAVKVAQMVKGVRAVVNRIEVDPPARSDMTLQTEVREALINDPATEIYEVMVEADDGVVTLNGSVDSWQEKQLAEFVTKGVAGVKSVNNEIIVDYKSDRSDYEIEQDVSQALEYDVRVDHVLIDVAVDEGVVILSGTVGSAAEKQIAIADSWVTGVNAVQAQELEAEAWARNEKLRKGKYVEKSDEEINKAIEDAFFYDPRVYAFNPVITVNNGYVTLSGIVNNLQAKHAAEYDARNVVGVFGVTNNIKVRPVAIPEDAQLEADIRSAVRQNPLVEESQVNVTANNGIVYLNGEVDTYFEKSQAEDIAAKTQGVIKVNNNLDVQMADDYDYYDYYGWNTYYPPLYDFDVQGQQESDAEIKNDIESQLWWSPYVNEDEIEVTVSDGTAVLNGTVETEREKLFAEINALEGGAEEVKNNLVVLYSP